MPFVKKAACLIVKIVLGFLISGLILAVDTVKAA